jgi:hypothetical protein
MSNLNSFTFDKLKLDFNAIVDTYNKINDKRTSLAERISTLKTKYNELIQTNNRRIFLFCLDSLHFQYKLLTIELDDIVRLITFINNRMYADYYKLYNLITLQSTDKYVIPVTQFDIKKMPVYKDHDPFYEYTIDNIVELHENIIQIIQYLFIQYSRKDREICEHNLSSNGFSIMNFINTLEYENSLLREQISLHVSYVSFFHNLQSNCLNKLLSKIQVIQSEVEANLLLRHESKQNVKIDNDMELNLFFVSPMNTDDSGIEHILNELESSVVSNEQIMESLGTTMKKISTGSFDSGVHKEVISSESVENTSISEAKVSENIQGANATESTETPSTIVSGNLQNQLVDGQGKDSIEIEDNNIIMLIGNIVNKIADNS